MTRLVLVRHAESAWNAAGRFQGQGGTDLSPRGREESRLLAAHLAERFADVSLIARSDLERVAETAAPAEAGFRVPVDVDPRLREVDLGAWSGRTRAEIAASDAAGLAAWDRFEDVRDAGGAGVEPWSAFRARVSAALHQALARADGGTALVFTHGGCVRVALGAVLGLGPSGERLLAPTGNAALSVLEDVAGELRVATYNETAYLAGR